MFTAALFTITRTWKQPKCLSTDEFIKKIQYLYTKRKNAICSNIDGHGNYHTERRKPERDKYILALILESKI